jgi:cytochrome o ubiquinol oxidase subunit 1
MGMTRRMQHYDTPEWRPWLLVAGVGALLILVGVLCQVAQLVVSIRRRDSLRDFTGDPWDGRSLEWSTASPPPHYNFAVMPNVEGEDAYWGIKEAARDSSHPAEAVEYEAIEMPRNSPTGVVCAFFATVMGFALIWHIWWMAILGLLGAWATFVVFAWRDHGDDEISAEVLAREDREDRARRDLPALPEASPA